MPDLFSGLQSVLSNPTVQGLVNQYTLNNQPAPPKVIVAPPQVSAPPAPGMSQSKMIMIGAAVAVLLGVVLFVVKRK